MSYKLSKSNYLSGLECPRYLWTVMKYPERKRKETIAEEFNFKEGIFVGELAKQLYPKGISIPFDDYLENILKTKEFLNKNKTLIEAGFEYDNCFARADFLVPNGEGWDILEVKKGTRVKNRNIHDLSFQKYIFEENGLEIKKCFLLYLNKKYVRSGELDIWNLFVKEDVSTDVDNEMEFVKERIDGIFEFISSNEMPEPGYLLPKIIKNNSHNCFTERCLELPPNNVFCLYGSKRLVSLLFKAGIKTIKDTPEKFLLNDNQKIQRECEIKEKPHIDKEKIKEFLEELTYPYYYLDFETFSTAIPMFNGLNPYFKVPFQFSLHVDQGDGGKIKHFEYLYNEKDDPREEFLLELQKVLGESGSIIVYYKSFEIGRLNELAERFPDHKEWINNVILRIIDLRDPFRKFSYYNPEQQGSASLKAVFSAMTEMSYEALEIRDGRTAPVEFLRINYEECDELKKQKVRSDLLQYCKQDTLAQVKIIEKLRELVK